MRLPGYNHRTVIIGRTGTGKSVFGVWLLSRMNIDRYPWLVIDFKGEEMFDAVHRRAMRTLKPGDKLPSRPGLYYINPLPKGEEAALDRTFWHIWRRGRAGILLDETVQVASTDAFEALLTQGRSKHIPMILCTQRPVDLSTYVFTQADFFAIFPVKRREDQRRVEDYLGEPGLLRDWTLADGSRIPEHYCYWYDVARDKLDLLTPVPDPAQILADINDRAPHSFWWR